jgi:diadenosine tetraphosphate (Ap4A) HIT family hydrolase
METPTALPCSPNCPICAQIKLCETGQHPRLIGETLAGWAVMGESQFFQGYSLLLCKTPARELHELGFNLRGKYLEEMALLAEAVANVVKPRKLNYECLGNVAAHLHFHVLPRHEDDPHPSQPVWTFWEQSDPAHFYNAERDDKLRAAISAELARLRA